MKNALLALALSASAHAAIIVNGGFESGFTGWTLADQVGGDGTFALQTGTASPVNLFPVPAPPEGTTAAMTDSLGPGSHVLYQDFVVPVIALDTFVRFSLFINTPDALDFVTPGHLDFATPQLNQRARVDILKSSADPFSIDPADILQNLYETKPGDPLVSGYTSILVDVSALLKANVGETLRLRFSEVDNVAPFNLGVDAVDFAAVPEPSSMFAVGALLCLGLLRRRAASMR